MSSTVWVDGAPGVATPPNGGAPLEGEAQLLARARRGDTRAFEALVRAHQAPLHDFCCRMLGDKEEALDVVQDVFISAFQALDGFREDARFSTWLYRIGRNHCLNRLSYLSRRGRGRSDDPSQFPEAQLAQSAGRAPGPEEALDRAQAHQRVQRAIGELEPEQRALVILRDLEGLAYEEIAHIAELPLGTVKSRLHRARERLAGLLAPAADGEGSPDGG